MDQETKYTELYIKTFGNPPKKEDIDEILDFKIRVEDALKERVLDLEIYGSQEVAKLTDSKTIPPQEVIKLYNLHKQKYGDLEAICNIVREDQENFSEKFYKTMSQFNFERIKKSKKGFLEKSLFSLGYESIVKNQNDQILKKVSGDHSIYILPQETIPNPRKWMNGTQHFEIPNEKARHFQYLAKNIGFEGVTKPAELGCKYWIRSNFLIFISPFFASTTLSSFEQKLASIAIVIAPFAIAAGVGTIKYAIEKKKLNKNIYEFEQNFMKYLIDQSDKPFDCKIIKKAIQ